MLQLKNLRQKTGFTQQSVADSLGISRPTYARYENGEREPSIPMLMKIATFYGVSLDFLLDFTSKPTDDDTIDDTLNSLIASLSDEDKVNVIRYVEFMQKRNNT